MSFPGIYFTNKGKALQAKAQTGIQLNFTRLAVGDGSLTGQDISDLILLIHEVKSITINKLKTLTGGKVTVGGVLTNQDLSTGFYFRELGLFATDPDLGEILYCYGNAANLAEYIPAPGGSTILEKQIYINAIIGNASNVSATIDQSAIYALAKDIPTKTSQLANDSGFSANTDYIRQPGYAITSGVANTYAAALNPAPANLVDGMAVCVKINIANTGASTLNVNGLGAKAILDSKGNAMTSGKLRLNGIYTLRYDGTNFILQGEGASGNATASDLLSGKTASTDAGDITGTMVNNGAVIITPGTADQVISLGYHNGLGKVVGDPDLISSNIKSGINIYGVSGKASVVDTADANAIAAQILAGQTGYINGSKVTGTMPNKAGSATILTPGTADIAIPQGFFDGLIASGKVPGDANLIAANILSGKSIFGVAGNVVAGKRYATGTVSVGSNASYTVSGLSFAPTWLIVVHDGGSAEYQHLAVYCKNPFRSGAWQGWYYDWTTGWSAGAYLPADTSFTSNSVRFTSPWSGTYSFTYYVYE